MLNPSLIDFEVHLGRKPNHSNANAAKIDVENVSFWYGEKQALNAINLKIYANEVTALSACRDENAGLDSSG